MKSALLLVVLGLLSTINSGVGLQCYSCDNEPSIFSCIFRGRVVTCDFNQGSCQTIVRRCGTKLAITKGCKQTGACFIDARLQVTPSASGAVQCNTDQESSVCSCCCEEERCNLNSSPCNGMQFDCEDRGEIENGTTSCSDGNRAGSICEFACNDPDQEPIPVSQTQCLSYGQWDSRLPCCPTSACPPFLRRDVVFLRQTNDEEAFNFYVDSLRSFAGLFEFGEYIQLGAIYDDGLALNNVRSINTMSSSNDREFFLNALDTFEFEGIASPFNVTIGDDLEFLLNTYFTTEEGDRPNVPNTVILQVDSPSTDPEARSAATAALRENGVEIYAVISPFTADEMLLEQLIEITGSRERILLASEDAEQFAEALAEELCLSQCG